MLLSVCRSHTGARLPYPKLKSINYAKFQRYMQIVQELTIERGRECVFAIKHTMRELGDMTLLALEHAGHPLGAPSAGQTVSAALCFAGGEVHGE